MRRNEAENRFTHMRRNKAENTHTHMRKSGLIHGHLVAKDTLYFLTSITGTDKPYLLLEQEMFLPTYAEHEFGNAKYPKTKPTYADATKL